MRKNGRKFDEIRNINVIKGPQKHPDGSVMIEWGHTRVICSVSIDDKIPNWMNSQNATGWVTAEYGMLPGSSDKRIHRDKIRSTGRTHEIQRLIGRSIRAAVDLKSLGHRTVQIDCDVVQADGGTRVAAITGSYLAFRLALEKIREKTSGKFNPQTTMVSAVSVGRVGGQMLLDLEYIEDVDAEVDANLVVNERMHLIEVQGTAEKGSFSRSEWDQMLDLGLAGCTQLFEIQRRYLKEWGIS
jgi:ribonuclease PH